MDKCGIIKVLLSIGFVSLAISGILLKISPISGYEIDIYASTPVFVWIAISYCITFGLCLLFYSVWEKNTKASRFWLLGLIMIILARLELLYIPFLRGYYTLSGDHMNHMGLTIDILKNHIIGDNSYPITHILCSEISLLTDMQVNIFFNYTTALFSIFYIISIYLILKTTSIGKKGQILGFVAAGGILFDEYYLYVMPNGWSCLFLPFVLYIAMRSMRSTRYSALLVIFVILYPFFHPLSSLILFGILVLLYSIYSALNKSHMLSERIDYAHLKISAVPIVLLGMSLVEQVLSYKKFWPNLKYIFDSLITGHSNNFKLAEMSDNLGRLNFNILDFLELLVKWYGHEIIYLVLLFLASCVFILQYKRYRTKIDANTMIFLLIPYLLGLIFAAYLLNLVPGLGNIGSSRILSFVVVFSPIPVSILLDRCVLDRNQILSIICILLILTASLLSVFSLYPSPYRMRPNSGVTSMDIYGMDWAISYRSDEYQFVTIMSPISMFADAIFGSSSRKDDFGINENNQNDPQFIDHFGYEHNTSIGDVFDRPVLALITQKDRIIYETVYKIVSRFKKDDFKRLNLDISVNKLYHNGESIGFSIT